MRSGFILRFLSRSVAALLIIVVAHSRAAATDYPPIKDEDTVPPPAAASAEIATLTETIDSQTLAPGTLADAYLRRGDLYLRHCRTPLRRSATTGAPSLRIPSLRLLTATSAYCS